MTYEGGEGCTVVVVGGGKWAAQGDVCMHTAHSRQACTSSTSNAHSWCVCVCVCIQSNTHFKLCTQNHENIYAHPFAHPNMKMIAVHTVVIRGKYILFSKI